MSRPAPTTTLPDVETAQGRWELGLRLVTIGAVWVLVLAAGVGLLGVRTAETSASGQGYEMTVTYAAVTRPGLATPFSIEIRTSDGSALPPELTVRISSDYLAIFDDNGMEPLPAESFNTEEWTWWTFTVPDGQESLIVDLDARLEPAVQWGRSGEAVLELDGEDAVSAEFTSKVAP
ncbi:MAG TPA: hypothetical protein VF115_14855 [Acidimicrobiia bacterium]